MDIFDLLAAGSLLIIEELSGILSLMLTVIIFIACVIKYAVSIYKAIKDKKITPEEKEELKKQTDELIEAAHDVADKINKKE